MMSTTTRRRSKQARGLRTRPMEDLSEELIMEILVRFPVRSLCCLKSVCSSWRTLISNPDFTWNHLRRSSSLRDPTLTPPRIAYDHWSYRPRCGKDNAIGFLSVHSIVENPSEPTKVAFLRKQNSYQIVGSCHGLLCLFDHDASCGHIRAVLWNPCTGFTFQSPQIRGHAYSWGFGYDHLSDTYKLIIYGFIGKLAGTYAFEHSTRIYTFGATSSWRRIDYIPHDCMSFGRLGGVYFGSSRACTLNWSCPHHDHMVFYFDLGKETYGHFPLPHKVSDDDDPSRRVRTTLCVLRNCLCVSYDDKRRQHWSIWQMKEYGDAQSWTKLAIIPFYNDLLQPLYISETNVLLLTIASVGVVLYNLNDGRLLYSPVINHFREVVEMLPYGRIYIYQESLVSPNGLQSNSSKMLLDFFKTQPYHIAY